MSHEQKYFAKLDRIDKLAPRWNWDPELKAKMGKLNEVSYNDQLTPLIHDIAQLRSWGYDQQLHLYEMDQLKAPIRRSGYMLEERHTREISTKG